MHHHHRRPRLECRISMDENELQGLFEETSIVYKTIEFINIWENYDLYRKCNETKACVLSNIDKNIIYVNKAWENLCGYTQSEIQGKGFEIFQGEDTNQEACEDFVDALRDTGYAKMINTNYDRNKNPIRVLVEGFKIKFKESTKNIGENMPHFWSTVQVI